MSRTIGPLRADAARQCRAGCAPIGRRRFLRCSAQGLALLGCGLAGRSALADGDAAAFRASSFAEALVALGGQPEDSDRIDLQVPSLVEDGSVVPVSVRSELADVEEVFVLAETNPEPLAVRFRLSADTEADLSLRIKLAQSGPVYGVVRAGGSLYWTSRDVKVTRGGCA